MPDNHKKPTTEELEAQIIATQAELDKQLAEDTPEPTPSEPIPTPSEQIAEPEPSTPVPDEEPETPAEPTQAEVDYKKKFTESQREALVLLSKNKKYEQISEVSEPTEDDLKADYPEWDEMNPTERKLAKESLWNRKRFDLISEVNKESKDIDSWNTKVDEFVVDPKVLVANPELEGKQEDFKIFATKPTRRGVDMPDLVLAFLGEAAKNRPAPKKGQMFESGSSGPNGVPPVKDDRISLDEAAVLMEKDYKKYKQYLLSGKIKSE